MRRIDLAKLGLVLLLSGLMLPAQLGCSRSSSSGSDGGSNGNGPTPTPQPASPTPIPTQEVRIDNAGTDIADVVKEFPQGARVIVSPGTYPSLNFEEGDFTGPLTLVADETGALTGRSGTITILGTREASAVSIEGIDNVILDGFTLIGGETAALHVVNASQVVVQNNTLRSANGDGIRFERSSAVLVFNNLIFANRGTGISAAGLNTMEAVNNTVHSNRGGGIALRRLAFGGDVFGSPFGFLRNNIIDTNSSFGILVDADSSFGFDGNYNLNNDGYVGVAAGDRDVEGDPLFIFPEPPFANFRMQTTIGAGGSPAFDRGDPASEAFFVDSLFARTTRPDSFRDVAPLDLGYHYPGGIDTPTPVPTFTPNQPAAEVPAATPVPAASAQDGQSTAELGGGGGSSAGGDERGRAPLPTATATATPVEE